MGAIANKDRQAFWRQDQSAEIAQLRTAIALVLEKAPEILADADLSVYFARRIRHEEHALQKHVGLKRMLDVTMSDPRNVARNYFARAVMRGADPDRVREALKHKPPPSTLDYVEYLKRIREAMKQPRWEKPARAVSIRSIFPRLFVTHGRLASAGRSHASV
jgi:hypothetical protein